MSVNACLCPVVSIHGCAVITVEGIGNTKTRLHPVQERIAKNHGSQCGFCTPGIVMSVYAMLRSLEKTPDESDLEIALQGKLNFFFNFTVQSVILIADCCISGNLCRCTGYRPILEGLMTLTTCDKISNGCPIGNKCCMKTKKIENDTEDNMSSSSEFLPYDPSQEPIFPPELIVRNTNNIIISYLLITYCIKRYIKIYVCSLQKSTTKSI